MKLNFKTAFKSFLRSWFLSATTVILLLGLTVFQIMAINSITGTLKDTMFYSLQFALVYLAVFLFISYEFFSKLRRTRAEEFLECIDGANRKFVFSQILVMVCVAAIFSADIFLINTIAHLLSGTIHAGYLLHIFLNTFLDVFMVCVTGVFVGLAIAMKLKRAGAYIIMLLLLLLFSNIPSELLFNYDLFKVYELFNITADVSMTPNESFGHSFLGYRWQRIFFWITLSSAVALSKLYKNDKGKKRIATSVCVALSLFFAVGFYMPASRVDSRAYYQLEEMEYYLSDEAKEYPADFKVTDYDIKLKVARELKGVAEMTLSETDLKEYRFTLYHGYRVKKVTDENGNKLDYDRDSDYITVKNPSGTLKKITISYVGSCMNFYANRQGVYLSGSFVYYPHPGFAKIYNADNQQFIPYMSTEYADFTVTVKGKSNVYSNLEKTSGKVFKGTAKEVTLYSGLLDSISVGNTEVIYPYMASDRISLKGVAYETEKLSESKYWKDEIKTVLSVPSAGRGSMMLTCGDFMEIIGYINPRLMYDTCFINPEKAELLNSVYSLLNGDDKAFENTVQREQGNGTASKVKDLIEIRGKSEVIEKLNDYIYNDNDVRTVEDFLQETE